MHTFEEATQSWAHSTHLPQHTDGPCSNASALGRGLESPTVAPNRQQGRAGHWTKLQVQR